MVCIYNVVSCLEMPGNETYGKFQHKTLMLYYQRFTRTEAAWTADALSLDFDWDRIRAEVFAGRDASELQQIQLAVGAVEELVFVCARKITGDFHVPMGSMSFGALVSPALRFPTSMHGLDTDRRTKRVGLDTVTDRSTKRVRRVSRHWLGWRTLAYPGFRSPQWTGGLFVQIAAERSGQMPGFAFCVNRTDAAIVLSRLPTQDTEPFLLKPRPEQMHVQ